MPRRIIGLIGTLVAVGIVVWRLSVTSTLFDGAGPAGDGSQDLAGLGNPAGALAYLNQVAETLEAMDADYQQGMGNPLLGGGNRVIGVLDSAPSTSTARGGRILTIAPDPAAPATAGDDCALDGDADGCAQSRAAEAPTPVTVFRPRQ